jgi:cell division septation protein DedD
MVHRASAGVPRLINRICDRALHQGYGSEVHTIDVGHVDSALKHLGMDDVPPAAVPEAPPTIDPIAIDVPITSGPLAEFASETSRPSRPGRSFPIRKPWSERIGRRPQPIAILALTGIVLCAATMAASSWYRLDPKSARVPDVSLPNAPSRPALSKTSGFAVVAPEADAVNAGHVTASASAGKYIIQVASFEDERRALQLVAQLSDRGYRAYQAAFELDGERWWQVSVGPYPATVDAERDLERVREIPGYDDATVRSLARP